MQSACCRVASMHTRRSPARLLFQLKTDAASQSSHSLSPSPFPSLLLLSLPTGTCRCHGRRAALHGRPVPLPLSSSFLQLLCPPLLATAGPQPATAASPRRASPSSAPSRSAAAGSCRAGQPRPDHGVVRPAAGMPRRPEHLDLGLLLPTGQPGHLPGDLTGHSRHFFCSCVQRFRGRRRRSKSEIEALSCVHFA